MVSTLAALEIASSRRLRSCITLWLFSGWFQKSGCEICSSSRWSSVRLEGASKIAPHSVSLLAERRILPLHLVQGHAASVSKQRYLSVSAREKIGKYSEIR